MRVIAFCHLELSLNRFCFSQGKHLIYTIIEFGKKCYLGEHTYFLFLKKILRFSQSTVNAISEKIEIVHQKKTVFTIFLENFPSFSTVCSLVSHRGYYCLSAWDIFASVGIVVTALAIDCDVGTFNLAT